MKKKIAQLLRRIANKIDPVAKMDIVTPMEFTPTQDLADEIRNRNDVCILVWGKRDNSFRLSGSSSWSGRPGEIAAMFEKITQDIANDIRKNRK